MAWRGNLYVHMVVKNEEKRYLRKVLSWIGSIADAIHVHDDCSCDGTVVLAQEACAIVTSHDGSPTFLEHEGRFRQIAWRCFEEKMEPTEDDWVLALDADEFLTVEPMVFQARTMGPNLDDWSWWTYSKVRHIIRQAMDSGSSVIPLHVYELFNHAPLMYRVDGLWETINGWRLFRYRPHGFFRNEAMGCGSEPVYVASAIPFRQNELCLLHFGYAEERDKIVKYGRYSGRTGHSEAHVESIMGSPVLIPWDGIRHG